MPRVASRKSSKRASRRSRGKHKSNRRTQKLSSPRRYRSAHQPPIAPSEVIAPIVLPNLRLAKQDASLEILSQDIESLKQLFDELKRFKENAMNRIINLEEQTRALDKEKLPELREVSKAKSKYEEAVNTLNEAKKLHEELLIRFEELKKELSAAPSSSSSAAPSSSSAAPSSSSSTKPLTNATIKYRMRRLAKPSTYTI